VGDDRKFRRALGRGGLPPYMKAPGASGTHKGIGAELLSKVGWKHLPWLVVVLVSSGEASLYDLSTRISTAGAYDLLDIQHVRKSWEAATQMNQIGAANNG
jgi:hypothetical protein